jgi:hypothetical protein
MCLAPYVPESFVYHDNSIFHCRPHNQRTCIQQSPRRGIPNLKPIVQETS